MPDICMCPGDRCPLRDHCYRHKAKPSELRQTWFMTAPYDEDRQHCDEYWPIDRDGHDDRMSAAEEDARHDS